MPISPSLQGLSRAVTPSIGTQPWNATTDPLGVNIQNQGMRTTQSYDRSQAASDYGIVAPDQAMGQSIGQAVHQMGPLEDPQWAGFFQAVSDAGGGKSVSYAGSSNGDPNSNQLTGYDTNNGTVGAGTEVYGPRGMRLNKTLVAKE